MKINDQRGIIKTIVIVLIGIILLSYFGIDLQKATQTDLFRKNLSFTWDTVVMVWTDYIYGPVVGLFHKNSIPDSTNLSQ
jgi:hypothetical protein